MLLAVCCNMEFSDTTFPLVLCVCVSKVNMLKLWNGSEPDFGQVCQLVWQKIVRQYLQPELKLAHSWYIVSKQACRVPVQANQPTSGQVHLLAQQEGTTSPLCLQPALKTWPPLPQSSFDVSPFESKSACFILHSVCIDIQHSR